MPNRLWKKGESDGGFRGVERRRRRFRVSQMILRMKVNTESDYRFVLHRTLSPNKSSFFFIKRLRCRIMIRRVGVV